MARQEREEELPRGVERWPRRRLSWRRVRREVLWVGAALVLTWVVVFADSGQRTLTFGHSTAHQAVVTRVVPAANCSRGRDGYAADVIWDDGVGYVRSCSEDRYAAGDHVTVWAVEGHDRVYTSSPTASRVIWFVVIPAVAVLFVVVLPPWLLRMKRWIQAHVRRATGRPAAG